MKKNTNNKKSNFKEMLGKALALVMAVATGLLVYTIVDLNILSSKYLLPALGVIILIGFSLTYWTFKSKGNTSKIITFIVAVVMLIGVTQISKVSRLVGKVTGADVETHTMNVVVMKDSPYKSMDDFENKNILFGANTSADQTNIAKAQELIEKKEKFSVEVKDYNNYQTLINDLYAHDLEVMIISESHTGLLEEFKPNFEEETRVIASYEFTTIVEKKETNTNVSKDTFSIYVTGIDTYGPISSVSRSDVNMIVTVNPVTHQILLTSIPRDYHVTLHSFGKKDKLTHAGIYGVNESVQTLEDLLSSQIDEKIEIDYYLRVNFTSVTNIVDALGGVEVNSMYNFRAGGHSFQKGPNHVYGPAALSFVRERYTLPNGDFDRIKNQQALITGVINKAMSPAIITNYGKFLNSIGTGFELSMSDKELNSIIKKQLDSMASWEIIDVQLKGYGAKSTSTYSMPGWNLYVTEPQYDTVKTAAEMIQKMEKNEPISKEADWPFN